MNDGIRYFLRLRKNMCLSYKNRILFTFLPFVSTIPQPILSQWRRQLGAYNHQYNYLPSHKK